jgi:hypothetical protein
MKMYMYVCMGVLWCVQLCSYMPRRMLAHGKKVAARCLLTRFSCGARRGKKVVGGLSGSDYCNDRVAF